MKCLKDLLRRIKSLGRPKIVTTDTGAKVTMQGLTPELADKVSALLKGEKMAEQKSETPKESPKDYSALKFTALGTFKDPSDNCWKVAVIKFNSSTNQAAIETIVNGGDEKNDSIERFKILAVENGVV